MPEGKMQEMGPQKYSVQYGPPGRYFVRDEETHRAVYTNDSKSRCIAKAEDLNGWPITGSEDGYALSRQLAKNEQAARTAGEW